MDALRLEVQLLNQLELRRLRKGDDLRAAVDGRRDPVFDHPAHAGEPGRQRHLPHRVVDVMQPHHVRPSGPQRREERHAVPDLDEGVTRAVPAHHLAERRPREHHVPAALADDAVAVTPRDGAVSGRVRGSHRDLDPGLTPQGRHLRGVQLRPAGFGIVEVAPREHAHATQTGARGDVSQLRDDVVGAATAHVELLAVSGLSPPKDSGGPRDRHRRGAPASESRTGAASECGSTERRISRVTLLLLMKGTR